MAHCNAVRSFTLFCLIKLLIESQVDAFAIHRVEESTFKPDLIVSESDVGPKDEAFKVIDIDHGSNNTGALTEVNKTEKIVVRTDEEEIKSTEKIQNDKIATRTPNQISNIISTSTPETEVKSNYDRNIILTVNNSETTSTEHSTTINSTLTEEATVSSSELPTSSEQVTMVTIIKENEISNSKVTRQMNEFTTEKRISNISENTTRQTEMKKADKDNDSYSTRAIATENTITESETSSKVVVDTSLQQSNTDLSTLANDDLIQSGSELSIAQDTTTEKNDADDNTKVNTGYNSESLIPYWKKYKEIDRRRPSSTEQTENSTNSSETLVHAESGQSSPASFSNFGTYNIASNYPSFEKLTTNEPAPPITDAVFIDDSAQSTQKTGDSPRIGVVTSLRAGYLDYSSRTTGRTELMNERQSSIPDVETSAASLSAQEISTESGSAIPSIKETTQASTSPSKRPLPERNTIASYETTSENILNSTQEVQRLASQSQLAEDAINEELMKEEVLTDSVDYTKRYQNEQYDVKAIKKTATLTTNRPQIYQTQSFTEDNSSGSSDDKLSVKPISTDTKNNSLYAVNPNYKPLKKIDVQPPKPFLRDPDDNSWRNESLSTLGIVFKAKNASKAFTQVLKNKTEMLMNTISDTKSEEQAPELRTRLEKIAEQRKSKKKKTDAFGNTFYPDYEENTSSERTSTSRINVFDAKMAGYIPESTTIDLPEEIITEPPEINKINATLVEKPEDILKTTSKPKKLLEEYDGEEEEVDYAHDIDLKRYKTKDKVTPTAPFLRTETKTTTQSPVEPQTRQYIPERKATIQYFPPRPKVVINEYDDSFRSKINEYTFSKPPEPKEPEVNTQPPIVASPTYIPSMSPQQRPNSIWQSKAEFDRTKYATFPPTTDQNSNTDVRTDGYQRPSYLIKHLRDFINGVAKDDDAYVTEIPLIGVTETNQVHKVRVKPPSDYYDYEAQFRKDVLDRFVENFNQHSERFKVDFPILYNTSVVHRKLADEGKGAIASSSAFMKRLYEDAQALNSAGAGSNAVRNRFDPNCDRTIELSPAYELHYYVPEEEQKEVQVQERRLLNTPPPYVLRL